MSEIAEKSSYVAPDDHDWSQYLGPEDLKINATVESWKKDPKAYADPEIQQLVKGWDDYIRTPKNADDPRWEVIRQLKHQKLKPVVAVDLMKQSRQRAAPTPPEPEKKKGFFSKFFKSGDDMTDDIREKGIAQLIAERFAKGVPTGAYAKSNAVDDALQQARDPAAYMNKIGAEAPRVTMDWSHDIDAIGAKPEGQTFRGGLGNQAREGLSLTKDPLVDAAWAQDGDEYAWPDTNILKKIFENNSPEDLSKIFGKDLVSKAHDFYKNYFKIA